MDEKRKSDATNPFTQYPSNSSLPQSNKSLAVREKKFSGQMATMQYSQQQQPSQQVNRNSWPYTQNNGENPGSKIDSPIKDASKLSPRQGRANGEKYPQEADRQLSIDRNDSVLQSSPPKLPVGNANPKVGSQFAINKMTENALNSQSLSTPAVRLSSSNIKPIAKQITIHPPSPALPIQEQSQLSTAARQFQTHKTITGGVNPTINDAGKYSAFGGQNSIDQNSIPKSYLHALSVAGITDTVKVDYLRPAQTLGASLKQGGVVGATLGTQQARPRVDSDQLGDSNNQKLGSSANGGQSQPPTKGAALSGAIMHQKSNFSQGINKQQSVASGSFRPLQENLIPEETLSHYLKEDMKNSIDSASRNNSLERIPLGNLNDMISVKNQQRHPDINSLSPSRMRQGQQSEFELSPKKRTSNQKQSDLELRSDSMQNSDKKSKNRNLQKKSTRKSNISKTRFNLKGNSGSAINGEEYQSLPTVALVEDDVDALLGEVMAGRDGSFIQQKKQATIRNGLKEKKKSGFKLGSMNDPNISLIEKANDDDPNYLFSERVYPQLEGYGGELTPGSKERGDQTAAPQARPSLLTVQTSLVKKGLNQLNNQQTSKFLSQQSLNQPVRKVSFAQTAMLTRNQHDSGGLSIGPLTLVTLIEESEKKASKKREIAVTEGKKGFGYHSRVLTHFSINIGVTKLRIARSNNYHGESSILNSHRAGSGSNKNSAMLQPQIFQAQKTLAAGRRGSTNPASRNTPYNAAVSSIPQYHINDSNLNSFKGMSTDGGGPKNTLGGSFNKASSKVFNKQPPPNAGFTLPMYKTLAVESIENTPAAGGKSKFTHERDDSIIGGTTPVIIGTNLALGGGPGNNTNQNNSMISMGTDNTQVNVKDDFPLPPMLIFSGRLASQQINMVQTPTGFIPQQVENIVSPKVAAKFKRPSITESFKDFVLRPAKPAQMTPQVPAIKPLAQTKKITFPSNISNMSVKDVSSQVYLKIKTAPPFSTIYLPDRHIVIPGLSILHPMTIIGTPATTLEILNGNILVDFRNFKATTYIAPQDQASVKFLIQETTIAFKMSASRLRERKDELISKSTNVQQEKNDKQNWNDDEQLLGADLSIRESFEQDQTLPFSLRGLKYMTVMRRQIIMPLIVVENDTVVEIRDSLLRSSRNESGNNLDQSKSDERSDWTYNKDRSGGSFAGNFQRDSFGKRGGGSPSNSEIEDICLWVNGDSINEQSDKSHNQDLSSMLLVTSCIFHNFHSVLRAGVNATFALQKSVFKECRGNAIHSVNPKAAMLDRCIIQNPKKNGILIEWLKWSDQLEVARNVFISACEVRNSTKDGILIQSYLQFSAHNLKILIQDNVVVKCQGDGISIKNLAISTLDIVGNEICKNQQNGMYLSQVHQKSNKFKFTMKMNTCSESIGGFGCYLYDTGILIEDCEFKYNEQGGMHVQNSALKTGEKQIPEEIKQFLEKFPMIVHLNRCEFLMNNKNGLAVEDYWKGPVLISDCKFNANKYNGVLLTASMQPVEQSLFRSLNNRTNHDTSSIMINGPLHPRKLQMSNTTANQSSAKVVPSTLFADESKIKAVSNYQNPMKNLQIAAIYMHQCIFADNKANGLNISQVVTDCNNCQFSGNMAHAINLADEEHYMLLKLRFSNYRQQLQGTVGGTWGVMTMQFKTTGCTPCGSFCGLGQRQTNAVLQKQTNDHQYTTESTNNKQTAQATLQTRMNTQSGSPRNRKGGPQVIIFQGISPTGQKVAALSGGGDAIIKNQKSIKRVSNAQVM